jgi:hypothetical protein
MSLRERWSTTEEGALASTQFDRAIMHLALLASRRSVIGGGLGVLGVGITGLQTEARNKKKKKCKGGKTRCSKRCVNLKTDAANCGACGAACGNGRICTNSVCGCPAGQSLVQGACIPTFGCSAQTNSCLVPQTNCPERPELDDAFCFATPDGQPFCGDFSFCVKAVADCVLVNGQEPLLLSCPRCPDAGDIGICLLPVSA